MVKTVFKKLFDPANKELRRCIKRAKEVDALADTMKQLTDEELVHKTTEFKERYKNGESLDKLLPEAYAVVREASTRRTGMTPFFVQIVGAVAIHGGNIAEMKTGEGKTLTAVMPAYLNALTGEGVHIVTVNEYLARREADGEIGDLFRFLGLTVGLNIRDLTPEQKKEVYNCDIVYSTNAELGFDYLRDHMVLYAKDMVMRPLNFAIIDEVDSILIDEARTPLIISGGAKNSANLYIQADRFAKYLADEDYEIDIEDKTVALTKSGIEKAEKMFNVDNLYDLKYVSLVHHINNALKANYTMSCDKEYMVQDDEVLIIDQFTGRILKGRQFNEGLHQALEAKEGVRIKQETITLATITYQNFFRMYKKLAGMTGTAKTEEEEFVNIYNMYVVEVPTNKPVIREDATDLIFVDVDSKYKYLIQEVKERHQLGQPLLIGTIAVETSEILSKLLKKEGIKHNVLNAKNHEREAEIIAHAGELGAVTIATNMAGRGTDIKLGEGVKELGGLAVLGSERHESRRIDNQLRGRSGRQGDPGYTRFFLSADDELLQRFGGESFKRRIEMVTSLSNNKDTTLPLESKMFARFINNAQKRIEGNNFDNRKNVLKYDDVMRKQREIIYAQRTEIITRDDIEDLTMQMVENGISAIAENHVDYESRHHNVDGEGLAQALNGSIFLPDTLKASDFEGKTVDEAISKCMDLINAEVARKKTIIDEAAFKEFLKVVVLRVVDTYWTKHIDAMSALRQSSGLQSYGQSNPFVTYQDEGFRMFEEMNFNISVDVAKYIVRAQIRTNLEREEVNKPIQASSGKEEEKASRQPVRVVKVGRNDPCPCGSGKKYKYCCEAKDRK